MLALSAIPELRRPTAVRPVLALQGDPARRDRRARRWSASSSRRSCRRCRRRAAPPRGSCSCFGLVFYGALGVRAARTFLLTRRTPTCRGLRARPARGRARARPADGATRSSAGGSATAGELIGIGLVGVPVALDLHRGAQSRPLAGDLRASELVQRRRRLHGPDGPRAARAAGRQGRLHRRAHARRGAAGRAGGRGARASPRRGCASWRSAACCTTSGKLSVPNEILQKPGALDGRGVRRDQAPPGAGQRAGPRARLLARRSRASCSTTTSGSTAAATRAAWAPPDLDIETRILAVCDVFDALLSQAGLPRRPGRSTRRAGAAQQAVRDRVRPGLRGRARASASRASRTTPHAPPRLAGRYAARSSREIALAALRLSLPM